MIHEIPHEFGDFALLLRDGYTRKSAVKAQVRKIKKASRPGRLTILECRFNKTTHHQQSKKSMWGSRVLQMALVVWVTYCQDLSYSSPATAPPSLWKHLVWLVSALERIS